MTIRIAIIGLNQIGASIGLCLAQIKDQATRIGHDKDPGVAKLAEKSGAVDKISFTLPGAVRDADVVILALPVDDIRLTLEAMAQDLKPGVVVIDTSPVKFKVMEWAKEFFPGNDRYFISVHLSLNPAYLFESGSGVEQARIDLFHNSLMLISNPQDVDESALVLTANLAQILGATPLFSDVHELDGLLASTRILPQVLAFALVNTTVQQPGWQEARKAAGKAYALATESAMYPEEDKELGQSILLNSENIVRAIDHFLIELQEFRDAIAEQNADEVQKQIKSARDGRTLWWQQRMSSDWNVKPAHPVQLPSGGEILGRLFGVRSKKDK